MVTGCGCCVLVRIDVMVARLKYAGIQHLLDGLGANHTARPWWKRIGGLFPCVTTPLRSYRWSVRLHRGTSLGQRGGAMKHTTSD